MTPLVRRLFAVLALSFACAAQGASVSDILGQPVRNERGKRVGSVSELIVDVRSGRVLYVIVDTGGGYSTFPIRALGSDRRLDMSLEGDIAHLQSKTDPRFRRAGKLLGQPVTHPHPGGANRLGTISDIEFDATTGEVERVVVADGKGNFGYPPGVLANGRFPPLTGWDDGPYPDAEALGQRGWIRRAPSDERRRLHDPNDW